MIALAEIEAARESLAGSIVRTPLVRLELEDAPDTRRGARCRGSSLRTNPSDPD